MSRFRTTLLAVLAAYLVVLASLVAPVAAGPSGMAPTVSVAATAT